MRPLLVFLLLSIGFFTFAPLWVTTYVRSQVWYLLTLQWLKEIRTVINVFSWIPAQCTVKGGLFQLGFMQSTMLFVWFVNARGWTDKTLRVIAFITSIHCFVYFGDVITNYCLCDHRKESCAAIIWDGVNSVSLFNWWVDGFTLQWVSVIFVVLEGWRVRMDLYKVFIYAILNGTFLQITMLPLFILEWRNHVRIADVMWTLKMNVNGSPLVQQALEDAQEFISQQKGSLSSKSRQSGGRSNQVAPAEPEVATPVLDSEEEEEEEPQPTRSSIRSRKGSSASTASKKAAAAATKSTPAKKTSRSRRASGRESGLDTSEESPAPVEQPPAPTQPELHVVPRNKARRHLSVLTPFGEVTDVLGRVFNGDDTDLNERVNAAKSQRLRAGFVADRLPEPGTSPVDEVDMDAVTKAFWAYSPEGVPASVLEANPSPVPFRKYPVIFGKETDFGLNLSVVVPIFLAVIGLVEIWTWLTWMDVTVRSHCWLGDFFEYAFVSPSSLMMTTGGWWGLFIWGTWMYSVEPIHNFKSKCLYYFFLLLNFHNVAWIMVVFILWREFRLRYLPSKDLTPEGGLTGSDRSVWVSSLVPSDYFCRPKRRHEDELEQSGLLALKVWCKIIRPALYFTFSPIGRFCETIRLTAALELSWTVVQSQLSPIARFLIDAKAALNHAIWLNWLDLMEFTRSLLEGYKHLTSSAPLPTPSSRQALIDWTIFVPYVFTTWVLCLNAYVACWYFGLNSNVRSVASGIITLGNAVYIHLRSHDKIRAQWYWLNYELDDEVQARTSLVPGSVTHELHIDEQEALQTVHAGTGLNMMEQPHAVPQTISEVISPRRKVLPTKSSDAEWYRPFEWNPHFLWTCFFVALSLLAVFVLIPDAQFDLPWWSKLYYDFRQNGLDGVHRGPGQSVNITLLLASLALLYPLFFGFSLRGPDTRHGMPFMSATMKFLFILPLLVTFGAVWNEETQPCYIPLGVEGPPVSDAVLAAINQTVTETIRQRAQPANAYLAQTQALRPVHPKTHGCLEAEFTTPYFVPAKFRAGIFDNRPLAHGGQHRWKAFVRFSNGALQSQTKDGSWVVKPDNIPDVRGMSVKLLQVDGEKALNATFLKDYPESRSQDFVSISSQFFFQNSAESYAEDFAFFANPSASSFFSWFFPKAFTLAEFKKTFQRVKSLYAISAMNRDGAGVVNPLDIDYYSAVAYRLGDDFQASTSKGHVSLAVKYRWKPCNHHHRAGETGRSLGEVVSGWYRSSKMSFIGAIDKLLGRPSPDPWSEPMTLGALEQLTASENPTNFLRINLQRRLDPSPDPRFKFKTSKIEEHTIDDEVCFDLMLQDQINACKNQVEDVMTEWKGKWTRVGRLTIPKQNFLSARQVEFCENLSFNPWHSLKVHKPLGQINQLRRTAYLVAADERRKLNHQNTSVVLKSDYVGDELSKLGADDYHLSGDAASYAYSDYAPPYNYMPKHITTVPFAEQMTNDTQMDIMSRFLFNERSIAYPQSKMRLEYSTPQDYEFFMLGRPGEKLINNTNQLESGRMRRPDHVDGDKWTSDVWWARQFIHGLNPMMIQRVTDIRQLPWQALGHFDAKINASIAAQLADEKVQTLDGLAKAGRLFFVDYEELDDIATYGDRVLYSPIAVFYLPAPPQKRDLLPLFIQLDRKTHLASGNRPRLFFPVPLDHRYPEHSTNEALVWLFAKMHVSSADAVTHQMVYHLLECHLAMEPTIVATHRAFSTEHPILRLLKQHFVGTIAINDFGRDTLLSDMHAQLDGFLSTGLQGSLQIMQKHYNQSFRFMETVPAALKRRGFDIDIARDSRNWGTDKDELPGFLYRDYGLAVWYKFHSYVRDVLSDKYGHEPNVQQQRFDADEELHAWFNELKSPLAGGIPRVPTIANFEQLVDFVTQVMFQGSAQHAAVNFAQFEYQAFQPARPLYLTRGMPVNLSLVDHSYMLRSLMPLDDVVLTNTVFDILSACCINTLMLDLTEASGMMIPETTIVPSFPDKWEKLKTELASIEGDMKANNAKYKYSYPYLYPSRIPQSIAI